MTSSDNLSHVSNISSEYYMVDFPNNTSADDSTKGFQKPLFTVWQSALIGLFLSTIILISVLGNVLVCVAVLTDRKLKKFTSNLFLISLALSDLVVSSLVMPFAVANDITGYWPVAHDFCNVWLSFDILSATASILNLCAISLDRYIHMKNPFRYEQWMTKGKCLGFIALIWLASILISFLPINLGWHERPHSVNATNTTSVTGILTLPFDSFNRSDEHTTCSLVLNPIYAVTSSTLSFYIPCIVMVAIYIKMYNFARHHAKKIKETQAFDASTAGKNKLGENKALFTLGMIMGLFLLSWIPFFTVNLVSSLCHKCVSPKLFVAFTWLGYFNSTMNPIIYSKFNADFRKAFKQILCCQRCRKRDPYDFKNKGKSPSHIALKRVNCNDVDENGTNNIDQTRKNGYTNGRPECKELMESQSLIDKEDPNENFIETG